MLGNDLNEITEEHLQSLINNSIEEGKLLEYKKELKIDSIDDKKEFLADVSSFANTDGGDILFGIEDLKENPTKIIGMAVDNVDKLHQKLDNIICSGISPQIHFDIKSVPLSEAGKYVIIIRIQRSWNKPHRVELNKLHRFYARSSSGKYLLDIQQLRSAFNNSSTVLEKIDEFRAKRLAEIGNATEYMVDHPKLILHLIPVSSFELPTNFQLDRLFESFDKNLFSPISEHAYKFQKKLSVNGLLIRYMQQDYKTDSSIQCFRNGLFEAINLDLNTSIETKKISLSYVECETLKGLLKYLKLMQHLGVNSPIIVYISFLNTVGYSSSDCERSFDKNILVEEHAIHLEPTYLENLDLDLDVDMYPLFRDMFDHMWNAFGFRKSPNFGEDGSWTRPYL